MQNYKQLTTVLDQVCWTKEAARPKKWAALWNCAGKHSNYRQFELSVKEILRLYVFRLDFKTIPAFGNCLWKETLRKKDWGSLSGQTTEQTMLLIRKKTQYVLNFLRAIKWAKQHARRPRLSRTMVPYHKMFKLNAKAGPHANKQKNEWKGKCKFKLESVWDSTTPKQHQTTQTKP